MKITVMLVFVVVLSACGQTKTQEYYMSHPEEVSADLAECKQLGKTSYNCNEADKAAAILKRKN